jgi:hypothetical protein
MKPSSVINGHLLFVEGKEDGRWRTIRLLDKMIGGSVTNCINGRHASMGKSESVPNCSRILAITDNAMKQQEIIEFRSS